MGRAAVIQLARLGDVVQSLPAIEALKRQAPHQTLDLVCAAPFAVIGDRSPAIDAVVAWDGAQWRRWAEAGMDAPDAMMMEADRWAERVTPQPYGQAYNLNQHARAVLAAHLLADRVVGPGQAGPLDPELPSWAAYLREVARCRADNRVHLADAFCGLCGVMPTGERPSLSVPHSAVGVLGADIGQDDGQWVALVVGAGDPNRCVPPDVWSTWIRAYLDANGRGRVMLVGGTGERERARAIEDAVPALHAARLWNMVGATTLIELMAVLARCQVVLGSDTGPLHLGVALGAKAVGWYFASARVHETGPYGPGHDVWQWKNGIPHRWPVAETVARLLSASMPGDEAGWQCWESHLDRWGTYYSEVGTSGRSDPDPRPAVWRRLGIRHVHDGAMV